MRHLSAVLALAAAGVGPAGCTGGQVTRARESGYEAHDGSAGAEGRQRVGPEGATDAGVPKDADVPNNTADGRDGLMNETIIDYSNDGHQNDGWYTLPVINRSNALRDLGVVIIGQEYIDNLGCSDTSCAYATQVYDQIAALGWVPYITNVEMSIQGRGLNITPPW
jgi:hypothetical protein